MNDPLDAQLRVESFMTFVPKPIGYAVVRNGEVIATITDEEVERAHKEFATMKARRLEVENFMSQRSVA